MLPRSAEVSMPVDSVEVGTDTGTRFPGLPPLRSFRAPVARLSRSAGRLGPAVLYAAPGAAANGVVLYAIVERLIDPLHGVYASVVITAFLVCFALFVASIHEEGRIYVESHWGGLGGGVGGWRVSRSLVFLLMTAATFAVALSALSQRPSTDVRERYRAATNYAARNGMSCDDRGIVGGRLVLRCAAPSSAVYNGFWNQIKLANPNFDDVLVERAVPPAPPAAAAGAAD
jgi:hypothetical protein